MRLSLSRQALLDFGLPAALATPGSILLPLVSAWWAALGALVLLLLFIAGVGFNLARGRKPNCHCFGQLYSKPIGWSTLVRNVLLAALAGFILGFGSKNPGLDAFSWPASLTLIQRLELLVAVLLTALFIAAGWLMVQMLKQQGRLLLRIETLLERSVAGGATEQREASEMQTAPQPGLPVGTPAPAFALPGLYGETITLDFLRAAGKPILLLFWNPGCGFCQRMLDDLKAWEADPPSGAPRLLVVSTDSVADNQAMGLRSPVLLDQDGMRVGSLFGATGTPMAVLVDGQGRIASELAVGASAVLAMAGQDTGALA